MEWIKTSEQVPTKCIASQWIYFEQCDILTTGGVHEVFPDGTVAWYVDGVDDEQFMWDHDLDELFPTHYQECIQPLKPWEKT